MLMQKSAVLRVLCDTTWSCFCPAHTLQACANAYFIHNWLCTTLHAPEEPKHSCAFVQEPAHASYCAGYQLTAMHGARCQQNPAALYVSV
jgi:hypothetical protein